jgi:TolB-like protein/DNA-binding winged helix-turn-helix (wHTH) protein/tetratricopeptide (TPR) repeat protein
MFHFGDFTLDVQEHTLKRAGQSVYLRPKSFATLAFLVEQRGRLVSKDELMDRIWQGVVVTDGTLTHSIEEIRRAIGDDPHHPQFVQTVPRIGYRFLADVRQSQERAVEEELVEEEEITTLNVTFRDKAEADTTEEKTTRALPGGFSSWVGPKRTTIMIVAAAVVLVLSAAVLFRFPGGQRDAISSLAVLPFENLSHDPEEDYFADGLTDALISEIARIGRLRVISRTSVMRYKNTRKPLSTIAEELQVDGIIEGSVFRSGQRVRITAALVAAGEERRLWGETYERDERDMVTLIRAMARTLAMEIPIELTPAERSRLSTNASVDPALYELYLKGRYYWNKRTAEGFRKGIECFERVIALDPYYAPAYVGLADSYNMLGDYDLLPPKLAFPKARAAALQALAIDQSSADAHASLAFSAMRYDWDWPEVEREYGQSIALDPNASNAYHWRALFLAMRGRFEEAKEGMKKAHALDPLALIVTTNLAWVHYFAREYDAAIAVCAEALELDSTFASAYVKQGWAFEQKKMYKEACAAFRTARNAEVNDPTLRLFLARSYALEGARSEALALIQQVTEESHGSYVSGYHVASAYAGLGDRARALEWLQTAYAERSGWLTWLNVDPKFDALRREPQFVALLDSLGLR